MVVVFSQLSLHQTTGWHALPSARTTDPMQSTENDADAKSRWQDAVAYVNMLQLPKLADGTRCFGVPLKYYVVVRGAA